MGKIRLLDTSTANKIAAGEVVERPASVVKELLENSLDAAADSIRIKVANGGVDVITVQDNGDGMDSDDVKASFQRHATSKISCAEDLNGIRTLGFRGEALASIAAVSKVYVCSRQQHNTDGVALELEAGKLIRQDTVGCPVGTKLEISQLFFNAPARKKFLANAARETAAISDLVNRLALAHSNVKFLYQSGKRTLLHTPGKGSLLDTIASVYGYELAEQLLPVEFSGALTIDGYISPPSLHRATTGGITLFINGRYIKDNVLTNTIKEAYGSRLPGSRFPMMVLDIKVDPGTVDVNVHPQKLMVKFDQPQLIGQELVKAVDTALAKAKPSYHYPSFTANNKKIDKPKPVVKDTEQLTWNQNEQHQPVQPIAADALPPQEPVGDEPQCNFTDESVDEHSEEHICNRETLPAMRVVGQFQAGYVVAEAERELYVIDQHGAHERILYQKYASLDKIEHCQLTVPQTFTLTADEAEYLVEHIFLLQQFGFLVEHFGGDSFILRGMPEFLTAVQGVDLLRDVVQQWTDGQTVTLQQLKQHMLLQLSCKGAVKEGQYLDNAEMDNILKQLSRTEYPFSCPHGRPIVIKISLGELKRLFLRQE